LGYLPLLPTSFPFFVFCFFWEKGEKYIRGIRICAIKKMLSECDAHDKRILNAFLWTLYNHAVTESNDNRLLFRVIPRQGSDSLNHW